MSEPTARSAEVLLEKRNLAFAIFLLLVALVKAVAAGQYLMLQNDATSTILAVARNGFLISIPVALTWVLWTSFLLRRSGRPLLAFDGFIHNTYVKAISFSWLITFLSLSFMREISESAELLPKFWLDAGTAMMLGAFSVSYLLLVHAAGDED